MFGARPDAVITDMLTIEGSEPPSLQGRIEIVDTVAISKDSVQFSVRQYLNESTKGENPEIRKLLQDRKL